ncbi:methyltransferase domain-containing protein [Palleronia sediminis]|uniref:Methyltransferase domain-containing protein n=1 Tax=Palleronia sediminis TaxID=2547833 RepID=A0A4R5ZYQ5_9RHOB|nr:methyltransferase domain-containing protein [Palleronia sediminis]TDL76350.1 methyltransferase domain-containing protein [Palleronia sediminis]
MSISDSDPTDDAFLGGRLHLLQPARGYRAGIDPVLLAAAVPARPGQSVLEIGCGVGTALLCLGARVPDLSLTGLELQPELAALARANAARNGIAAEIATGDLAALPAAMRARQFDHVLTNPPYFAIGRGTRAALPLRDRAMHETLELADWIAASLRRVAPGGWATVIQKADRMPDLIAAMQPRLGALTLRPIRPRRGRDAALVILSGRKASRAPARVAPALVLHDGARHEADRDDYSAVARAILRDGAAIL